MAMRKTDNGNITQLIENGLDDAITTHRIKVLKYAQSGIQGNDTPFYLPLSECGETYASDNSSIPSYLSFEAIENNLDIDQYKFVNSDIEPIIESEGDIKDKSETSKTLSDNTSTVKTVSTKNIDIDQYKTPHANCEIKPSIGSDYEEKCETETLFKTIYENKQNICKYLTLGFLLSVVCCLIYYFASESFELVEESTLALKTSNQFKYLFNTFNSSTKLTPSTKVTMPMTPSTFKVGHRLHVTNGDNGGRWNSDIYCQPGTYACGFRLKVEKDKSTFEDDAGLTNVQLYCKNSKLGTKSFVASSISDYNTNSYWRADIFCTENYYLVAFQLRVDPRQWFKADQTAVTNINFVCRGPGLNGLHSYNILGNGMMQYGDWGTISGYCEIGTAICGMQTKGQTVTIWDKLGMTDLELLCCHN